ncbi:MAG: 3-hydroxyacyl-CoA dehydrogenase NAD-binding domain-containing protein, partial [Anaerolineales bacterium]
MKSNRDSIIDQLRQRTATVAVIGLGYVGLPLAAIFAEAGFDVVGIEPDERKVEAIRRGESYIQDVSESLIGKLTTAGKLRATQDFSVLESVQAVSICVPTPLRKTGDPDLSFILDATNDLAKYIHPGMVVVL